MMKNLKVYGVLGTVLVCILASVSQTKGNNDISALVCWKCNNQPIEECLAQPISERCGTGTCFNSTVTYEDTNTGKISVNVTKGCGFLAMCSMSKEACDATNTSTVAPFKMTACSFLCCTTGDYCVNATENATTTASSTSTAPAVTTPNPQAAYSTSPWATDMSLCKTKCCGATPAQTWQNRTCCSSRDGGCLGVNLVREVKCEDTYCNEKHCGACLFGLQPLNIMTAAILSTLFALVA